MSLGEKESSAGSGVAKSADGSMVAGVDSPAKRLS